MAESGTVSAMAMDQEVIQLAMSHGGLASRQQLLGLGRSRHWIDREVQAGRLAPVRSGIYRVCEMTGHIDRLRAAVLTLPNAVVSHESAAHLLHFPNPPKLQPTVTVPARTTHVFPGVTVHRTADLSASHIVRVGDLPTTNVMRTVYDLAAVLSEPQLDSTVEDLVLANRLELTSFRPFVAGLRRRGKPGGTVLGVVIDRRLESGAPDASRLERLGLQVLRDGGLPEPILEYPAPWNDRERIDAAYPPRRVGIEWDSTTWHSSLGQRETDRQRDRMAAAVGWTILRYTWRDLTERPGEVASQVAAVLAQRNG